MLALVHDEAGYGFEVIAAKLSAEQRATAEAAAAAHRARSEDWAAAAGIDGTAQDPRRASYTLPAGLDDPAVATALGAHARDRRRRRLRERGRAGRTRRAGRR